MKAWSIAAVVVIAVGAVVVVLRSHLDHLEPTVALCDAIERGDVADVRALLNDGVDPDTIVGPLSNQPAQYCTALVWAVANGESAVCGVLLEARADPNALTAEGDTALRVACAFADKEVVDMLLEAGADPNRPGSEQIAPLHIAVESGAMEIVDLLLSYGANVESRDEHGRTPLFCTAQSNAAVLRKLLAAGARMDATALDGTYTPLMNAAFAGNAEVVEALIEAGVDVDARTQYGHTALLFACGNCPCDLDTVQNLLQAGADPNVRRSSDGYCPLILAVHSGDVEIVEALLASGADRSLADHRGRDALEHAKLLRDDATGYRRETMRAIERAIARHG